MNSIGSFQPSSNADLVAQLVAECKHAIAAKYLYALRRVSMNQWLVTGNQLLRLADNPSKLGTYATLLEVSKGSIVGEKAHMIPGLSGSANDCHFDYDMCVSFIKKIRRDHSPFSRK